MSSIPRSAKNVNADAAVILTALHRRPGYMTVHNKVGDRWRDLGAVSTSNIPEGIHPLLPEMQTDSYYGINTLGNRHRAGKNVAYINAIFCDVDCHSKGIRVEEALVELMVLEANGLVPPPSMIERSGRGVWVFFILDPPLPALHDWEVRQRFTHLEHALVAKLEHLGADAKSTDLPRVTRFPGSVNSKAQSAVLYTINYGEDGRVTTYTLEQLEKYFPPSEPVSTCSRASRKHPPNNINTRSSTSRNRRPNAGWIALQKRRLRLLLRLDAMRHGFSEGCRSYAVLLFAHYLRTSYPKAGKRFLHVATETFAERCKPPLSQQEVTAILRWSGKRDSLRKLSDAKIVAWLQITEEEHSILWPSKVNKVNQRTLAREQRRHLVSDFLSKQENTHVSLSILQTYLKEHHDTHVSTSTLKRDLRTIRSKEHFS